MRRGDRGFALILVLILLGMGALLITPSLRLADTTLKAKGTFSDVLQDQYARDGAAEYAVWELLHGDATTLLGLGDPNESYAVVLNGITVDVTIRMRTELGTSGVAGAEDNQVRATMTVVCDDIDPDALYDDDCSNMTATSGTSAKYTVTLKQVSPDLSVGIVAVYDEMPSGVTCKFANCAATSTDFSFTEIESAPTTVLRTGGDEIWKWDFSSSPIYFTQQGEEKVFEFEVDLPGGGSSKRHCNQVFMKMETAPHEKSGKTAIILVGNNPPEGCDGGGMSVDKFVDSLVATPGVTTKFTYIINVQNLDGNTLQLRSVKDVLPQGTSWGSEFQLCDPANPPPDNPDPIVCEAPIYKIVDDPFDPDIDNSDFATPTGFSPLNDPAITPHATDIRWEMFWDFTNNSSPCALPGGCSGSGESLAAAGGSGDVLIIRFQAHVTPEASGSYFNEVFVDATCSAPNPLISEGVTTTQEYCASYSWPTGGTLVPMYDVLADADTTSGQGNVAVGASTGSLQSWYVTDK